METGGVTAPPGVVVPPLNFAMVSPGIYRSGYPRAVNHSFLRTLKLKTILYLCPEDYREANIKLCADEGITLMQFGLQGNKEPFTDLSEPVRPPTIPVPRFIHQPPLLPHTAPCVLLWHWH
jgi:tyrosine-protein phosphatase SIW14